MILETAQLLCTAHHLLSDHPQEDLYKITHKNHPCAIWARENISNYMWLYDHFVALSMEYERRYGKVHKTYQKLKRILYFTPDNIPNGELTLQPLCMPNEYKKNTVVESYRAYYISKSETIKMKWTKSTVPEWFNNDSVHSA